MVWILLVTIVHLGDLLAGLQSCPHHLQGLAKQVKPTPTFTLLHRLFNRQPDAPDTILGGSLYKCQVSCRNQDSPELLVLDELEIVSTLNYPRSASNPPRLVPVTHVAPQPLTTPRIATGHDKRPCSLVSHAPGLAGHHVLLCTVKYLFDPPLRDLHESGWVELAETGVLALLISVEEDAAVSYGTARHTVVFLASMMVQDYKIFSQRTYRTSPPSLCAYCGVDKYAGIYESLQVTRFM
mmetsp:Transcript_16454/g.32758  ORF Transcript_16454/g.32758 Transcript_16454/m.32758 type:complete len:239 (+) Transcript_16454:303-1019(+)